MNERNRMSERIIGRADEASVYTFNDVQIFNWNFH